MKSNMTMDEFKSEVRRREESKEDFIAPSHRIRMMDDGNRIGLQDHGEYTLQQNFHSQLANHLRIPKRYYDDMQQIPSLRAANVNAWLVKNGEEERMVRTLDNEARAFLSSKFRPFDNLFALKALTPVFDEFRGMEIQSSSLTDTRMYLQLVFPTLNAEVKPGDVVNQGIVITNSEVGRGALDVSSLIWRLACSNGMISQSILSRKHVGSRINFATEDVNIYQHDTIEAELESYRLRIRDVVRHALQESVFMERIEKLREAAEDGISKRKVKKTIENVTKKLNIKDDEIDNIFANISAEADYTRYGMANAVTALAHESNPDDAYEYERAGNTIIELSPSEWKVLAA